MIRFTMSGIFKVESQKKGAHYLLVNENPNTGSQNIVWQQEKTQSNYLNTCQFERWLKVQMEKDPLRKNMSKLCKMTEYLKAIRYISF
mgnify:CR=1 FL=1